MNLKKENVINLKVYVPRGLDIYKTITLSSGAVIISEMGFLTKLSTAK